MILQSGPEEQTPPQATGTLTRDLSVGSNDPQPPSTHILSLPDHVLSELILPRVSNSAPAGAFLTTCKAAYHNLNILELQVAWLVQNRPDTALYLALEPGGSEALFLQLLDTPGILEACAPTDQYGRTLLMKASAAGFGEVVYRLLQLPSTHPDAAMGNGGDEAGYTALEWAALCGHAHAARLLLQAGVSRSSRATLLACKHNHPALLEVLLDNGRMPIYTGPSETPATLFWRAKRSGYWKVALLLFDYAVDAEVSLIWMSYVQSSLWSMALSYATYLSRRVVTELSFSCAAGGNDVACYSLGTNADEFSASPCSA